MGGGSMGGPWRPRWIAVAIVLSIACMWMQQVSAWSPAMELSANRKAATRREMPRAPVVESSFLQTEERGSSHGGVEDGGKRVFGSSWDTLKAKDGFLERAREMFREAGKDQRKYEVSLLKLSAGDEYKGEARQHALEYRLVASLYLDLPWINRVVADPVCMHYMLHDKKMAVGNHYRPAEASDEASVSELSWRQAAEFLNEASAPDGCKLDSVRSKLTKDMSALSAAELASMGGACGMNDLQLFWCDGQALRTLATDGFSESDSGKSVFFSRDTETFHVVQGITKYKLRSGSELGGNVASRSTVSKKGLGQFYPGVEGVLSSKKLKAYFSEASIRYPSWPDALSQFPMGDGVVLTTMELEEKFMTMRTLPEIDSVAAKMESSVVTAVKKASTSSDKVTTYLDHVKDTAGGLGVPDMALFHVIAEVFQIQLELYIYNWIDDPENLRLEKFGADGKPVVQILGVEPLGREFYGLHKEAEGEMPLGVVKRTVRRRLLARYDVSNVNDMLAKFNREWTGFQGPDLYSESLDLDGDFNVDSIPKREAFAHLKSAIDNVSTGCPCCVELGEEMGLVPKLDAPYNFEDIYGDDAIALDGTDEMKTDVCLSVKPSCGSKEQRSLIESPYPAEHVRAMFQGRPIHVFRCSGKKLLKRLYRPGVFTMEGPLQVFESDASKSGDPSYQYFSIGRALEGDDGRDKSKQVPKYGKTKCKVEFGVEVPWPGYKFFNQVNGEESIEPVSSANVFINMKRCFVFELAVGALIYGNTALLDKLVYLDHAQYSIFGEDSDKWTGSWYAFYLSNFNKEKMNLLDANGRNLLYFVSSSASKETQESLFHMLLLGKGNSWNVEVFEEMLCSKDVYGRTALEHYKFYQADVTYDALLATAKKYAELNDELGHIFAKCHGEHLAPAVGDTK